MENDVKEFLAALQKKLKSIDYIKTEDIPNIGLYMDQVTTFMDKQLEACKRHDEDKILTKTMINLQVIFPELFLKISRNLL